MQVIICDSVKFVVNNNTKIKYKYYMLKQVVEKSSKSRKSLTKIIQIVFKRNYFFLLVTKFYIRFGIKYFTIGTWFCGKHIGHIILTQYNFSQRCDKYVKRIINYINKTIF